MRKCTFLDKDIKGNLPDLYNLIMILNKTRTHTKIRCKYCHRVGHTDASFRDKQDKRPPSMPQWAKHSTCMKCKKKGHLAFNCPPKYNCKVRKPPMGKNKPYNKNNSKTQKEESAALVKEFAGMVIDRKSTRLNSSHP